VKQKTRRQGAKPAARVLRGDAARIQQDPRWLALRKRSAGSEPAFFYAVKTTGVYCRPSCGARPPRPENVEFYPTTSAAEQAGFRACKRCKPDQPPLAERNAADVAALCRLIDESDATPTLEVLARHAGRSRYHTHRLFKAVTGLTPRAYAAARRAERVRTELRRNTSVTSAIYGAGYNSGARFYEKSNMLLGMTPRDYRAGGDNRQLRFATSPCALGLVLVATSERGVCAILLGDDATALQHDLERRFPKAKLVAGAADFAGLVARVVALVEQPGLGTELPLDIRGTAFQQRVWQALCAIPAGKTASYSELASAVGAPQAVRAVAGACAANSLAVAIPCHRVVGKSGKLNGYRWGVERKRQLLEREAKRDADG
jgi:AraC family transcriptional regulator of adaptative response/methylated-DNA-[protein]-cysteine methyltransferase